MSKIAGYKWHAVYVKSRAEKKTFDNLVYKGIKAYLPLRSVKKKWSDRIKVVEEPLLKGYLFVYVSNREYVEVLKANGIVAYVTFGGVAAEIPEKQIDDLRLFLEKLNANVQVSSDTVVKGEKVRVISGVLEGVEGEISEVRGKKRIGLRFECLGCSVFADVSIELIEKTQPLT